MSNVSPATGGHLTVLVSLLFLGIAPVRGQLASDPSSSSWSRPQPASAHPATVSADVLRHPLSLKARRLLQKAMHLADLGNHRDAIQGLQEALVKEPSVAPYAANFLGLEYMKMRQFAAANNAFEEAARLMPRDSVNHSNLSVSLAMIGEWDSAEKEVRKAIELDHANFRAASILAFITSWRQAHRDGGLPGKVDQGILAGGF